MLSIIKTAIITITISFISGVLLDHYKNIAPRIVCHMGKYKLVRINNKKIKVYAVSIKNISKQTIHNLNINLQANCIDLKIDNAEITKGLSFDISSEGNVYNVNIPFIGKEDEFSFKIFLEGTKTKPTITLKSPENFKRIDCGDSNKFIAYIRSMKNKFLDKDKKFVIPIVSVVVLIVIGIFTSMYFKGDDNLAGANEQTTNSNSANNSGNVSNKVNTDTSNTNDKSKSTDKSGNSTVQNKSEGIGNSNKSTVSDSSRNENTENKNSDITTSEEKKSNSSDNKSNTEESSSSEKVNEGTKGTSGSNGQESKKSNLESSDSKESTTQKSESNSSSVVSNTP